MKKKKRDFTLREGERGITNEVEKGASDVTEGAALQRYVT